MRASKKRTSFVGEQRWREKEPPKPDDEESDIPGDEVTNPKKELREGIAFAVYYLIFALRLLCICGYLAAAILVGVLCVEATLTNWILILFSWIAMIFPWFYVMKKHPKTLQKIWFKSAVFSIIASIPLLSFKWCILVCCTIVINLLLLMMSMAVKEYGKTKKTDTIEMLQLKQEVLWLVLALVLLFAFARVR